MVLSLESLHGNRSYIVCIAGELANAVLGTHRTSSEYDPCCTPLLVVTLVS